MIICVMFGAQSITSRMEKISLSIATKVQDSEQTINNLMIDTSNGYALPTILPDDTYSDGIFTVESID